MKKEISLEALEKLKKELNYLKKDKRREIAERLKEAISFGDLKENAAYHEAKDSQAFLEGRIMELERAIKTSTIVKRKNTGVVGIGSTIKVKSLEGEEIFHIVNEVESDPFSGKISESSPLGKCFINCSVGDDCIFESLNGEKTKYKIIEVK